MLRQRILKYLLDKERETSGAIPELGDIAQNVGASKEDVSDQIDILDSNGAVKANRTFGGGAAPMLTGSGKALLEELNEGLGSHQSTHRQIGAANNSSGVRPFGWDVFICHASEDKAAFVEQLAHQLRQKGLRVWYDDFTLKLGDSLRRSIDNGLKTSMYGIVVLSPRFFEKNWPQKELDGLVIRERDGKKVILPVWLNVGANDVEGYSPTLADRVAANVKDGMQKVVEQILAVVI